MQPPSGDKQVPVMKSHTVFVEQGGAPFTRQSSMHVPC
jgi:hypothetical protein